MNFDCVAIRDPNERFWDYLRQLADDGEVSDDEVLSAIKSLPPHYSGITSVALTWYVQYRWSLGNNLPWSGQAYNQTTQASSVTKTYSLSQANANNTSGGANEAFSFQQVILAGQSATVNLQTMTDLMSQTSVNIARIKSWMVRLLSLTDDSTIGANTNANSKICVTNNGPTCPAPMYWGSGGSGLTLNITNSAGGAINTVAINAAGSGYMGNATFPVSVNQVNGAQSVVSVTTNAAGVPIAVASINGGTGYVVGNGVPTTELGSFWLQTGNAQMIVDVTPNGTPVTNTQKNILISNMDPANAVTFELDAAAGTS